MLRPERCRLRLQREHLPGPRAAVRLQPRRLLPHRAARGQLPRNALEHRRQPVPVLDAGGPLGLRARRRPDRRRGLHAPDRPQPELDVHAQHRRAHRHRRLRGDVRQPGQLRRPIRLSGRDRGGHRGRALHRLLLDPERDARHDRHRALLRRLRRARGQRLRCQLHPPDHEQRAVRLPVGAGPGRRVLHAQHLPPVQLDRRDEHDRPAFDRRLHRHAARPGGRGRDRQGDRVQRHPELLQGLRVGRGGRRRAGRRALLRLHRRAGGHEVHAVVRGRGRASSPTAPPPDTYGPTTRPRRPTPRTRPTSTTRRARPTRSPAPPPGATRSRCPASAPAWSPATPAPST